MAIRCQSDRSTRSTRRAEIAVLIVTLLASLAAGSAAADVRLAPVVGDSAYPSITKRRDAQDHKPTADTVRGIGFTLAGEQATPQQPQETPDGPSTRGGGYVVQVSSQRREEDAKAFYKKLQNMYPSMLRSRAPMIKRVEIVGSVSYRTFVGPFATTDDAAKFCSRLWAAGGACFVPKTSHFLAD